MIRAVSVFLLVLVSSIASAAEAKLPQMNEAASVAYHATLGLKPIKAAIEPQGAIRDIHRDNYYNLTVAVSWEAMNEEITVPLDKQFRVAQSFLVPNLNSGTIPPSGTSLLTPTALKFMAASGCNDANNGLTTGAPWCTPNHASNCGDVILTNAGTYNGSMSSWGTVSSCPSTTGGIDGLGGVWTVNVLCAGADIEACIIDCATAACNGGAVGSGGRSSVSAAVNINHSNWSMSGWVFKGNGASHRGFQVDACLTTSTIIDHVAAINIKVQNAAQAWDGNDCGYGSAVPGNGTDYLAAVGLIAQGAAQDTICLAAVDFVGPANANATAGVHTYIDTIWGINSQSPSCVAVSDGEAVMMDTLDAHGYTGQITISNVMAWLSMRNCIQLFYQNLHVTAPVINLYNNTCYDNLTNIGSNSSNSEINFSVTSGATMPWVVSVTKSIALTGAASSGSGPTPIYALTLGLGPSSSVTLGASGTENVLKGSAATCVGGATCAGTNSVASFNSNPFGTNFYLDPLFTNKTDLTNWAGIPSCTGFVTTTACMGWDAGTSTLTTLTPISDLTATLGSAAGKGFQPTSTTCLASFPNYATWLKTLNRQGASGWTNSATINVYSDLAQKLCGT